MSASARAYGAFFTTAPMSRNVTSSVPCASVIHGPASAAVMPKTRTALPIAMYTTRSCPRVRPLHTSDQLKAYDALPREVAEQRRFTGDGVAARTQGASVPSPAPPRVTDDLHLVLPRKLRRAHRRLPAR